MNAHHSRYHSSTLTHAVLRTRRRRLLLLENLWGSAAAAAAAAAVPQQVSGVWSQLQRLKQIVPEPRKAGDEFDAAIAQYYKAVAEGRGGLFMAVCRGKVRPHGDIQQLCTAELPL
jgi:uncharacterized protein (DUF2267 family)